MLSLSQFRSSYPEFNTAPDPLIQGKLDLASKRIDQSVWGDRQDEGHGLLTAHILCLSAYGQMSKLSSVKGETTYGKQFHELESIVAGLSLRTI